jgi:hypothetical protein
MSPPPSDLAGRPGRRSRLGDASMHSVTRGAPHLTPEEVPSTTTTTAGNGV